MRRLIAFGGALLLAFLLLGAEAAKTGADKSQSVVNFETVPTKLGGRGSAVARRSPQPDRWVSAG